MRTVYADEVFLINALVDYALIMVTARVAGANVKRGRAVLAAALGGLYAVFAAVYGGALGSLPVTMAVGTALALIVFGGKERFFRYFLLFLAVAAAFGGAVTAAEGGFGEGSWRTLTAVFLVLWGAFSLTFRGLARHGTRGELCRITARLGERTAAFTALRDTGNTLRDPVSGRPAVICGLSAVESLFDAETAALLRSRDPVEALPELTRRSGVAFVLLPYRAVGVKKGLAAAFSPDSMTCGGKPMTGLIALAGEEIGTGRGYSAIAYAEGEK